ncbi:MAG: DUF1289 domain-containing protein [Novosphingobium sp.]
MYDPPSPCTGVCRIEPARGQSESRCAGCHRTLDEIADWPIMTSREKALLLDQLGQRA